MMKKKRKSVHVQFGRRIPQQVQRRRSTTKTLRNAFLFVRFSSRVLPYAKKIVYRNRVPDFKKALSVCGGSISTSLYNPLGGAYYRSYGCSSINPRHSAKTAVACTLQLNKINLTSTKQRIT